MKNAKPRADLSIRVIPRSPRTCVDGMRGDAILIRLNAPPVDGAANEALIAFLSGVLAVPRRDISLLAGEKSRDKRVRVDGVTQQFAVDRLR